MHRPKHMPAGMKARVRTGAAAALLLIAVVSLAAEQTAQTSVTWMVFVDDLHLDFRNTGRLRDLLRLMSKVLFQQDDWFAFGSSGPSKLSTEVTQSPALAADIIKMATGNALKLSDIQQGGRREARYRANIALAAAKEAIGLLAQGAFGRRILVYVSNGYDRRDVALARLENLVQLARENAVTIVVIDPRGLFPGSDLDAVIEPATWNEHLANTREVLRMLADGTGGSALLQSSNVSHAIGEIGAAARK